jgi:hypothetical protein
LREPNGAGCLLLEDIERAGAAAHVDAAALLIEEHVIGITAGIELFGDLATRNVDKDEARWIAENTGDEIALRTDSEREIGIQTRYFPGIALPIGGHIHHRDLLGVWHIDERCPAIGRNLKALGMSRKRGLGEFLA